MHKLKIGLLVVILLYGCSQFTKPSGVVKENVTMYTGDLKCLGKLIKKSNQDFKATAAVNRILDKTGKAEGVGGKPLTQAASDMALTALSEINAIKLIGVIDTTDIGPLSIPKMKPTDEEKDLLSIGNIGSIYSSHFFLTGSISEYNDDDIGEKSWGIDLFRKYLDFWFSGSDKIHTVAMDLRLVGSKTGTILIAENGELLNISLKNEIHVREFDGGFFRIFNAALENGGGIDYASRISNPKHLAVREIIEKAIFILIGKMYEVPFEQCQMATPFEANLGGSMAQYMSQKDQGYAQQVLEIVPTNELVEWESVDIQYTMLSTKTYQKDENTPCRKYYISILRDKRKEGSKGTACRQANGVWKDI